ncbi:endonuclease/exonuclease/phosphatase family protein [Alienimonas sp. DA493]|uniref:endonuclease/exonuclease/phosphatase family protein n=1 Tax=Alienimonas sp. DA493 TaxID=3373605 RepID=UPI0037544C6C
MDEPPARPSTGSAERRRRSRLWWALAALPFVPWLIGLAGRWWWFAELFTHFRFQWLLATGAVGLVLLCARQWRPLALCGVAALLYGGPLLTLRFDKPIGQVTIVSANVLTRNADAAPLLTYLEEKDPEVVCLQEIDARWAADLAPLHERYPNRLVVPRSDNFGIAIYSRFSATFETIDLEGVPMIRATVPLRESNLVLFNVHTLPPIGAENAAQRNRQMTEIAQQVAATDGPVAVCGDLNCTPWSPYFADLLDDAALSDPRGGGRSPVSWQAQHPLFALPIDHVLAGGGAYVTSLEAGPNVGSDHRPLRARVVVGNH